MNYYNTPNFYEEAEQKRLQLEQRIAEKNRLAEERKKQQEQLNQQREQGRLQAKQNKQQSQSQKTQEQPNFNQNTGNQNQYSNPNQNTPQAYNEDDYGIDNKGKKIKLNDLQKNQRDYLSIIDKKRETEGFPSEPKVANGVREATMCNYKGGRTRMTGEENYGIPIGMEDKDYEMIKYLTNDKLRKENPGSFDNYWDRIKEKYNLSNEVKLLTRDKFNNLPDKDKLRLYKSFNAYERQKKEEVGKQKQEREVTSNNTKNIQEQITQTKQAEKTGSINLEKLKAQKQKIYEGVQNMNKGKYNSLSHKQKKQIQDTYQDLDNQINDFEKSKPQEQPNIGNEEKSNNSKGLEDISNKYGKDLGIENGEMVIEGIKDKNGEDLKINLYDENGNLKDKNILDLEISKHFLTNLVSTNNNRIGMTNNQRISHEALSKIMEDIKNGNIELDDSYNPNPTSGQGSTTQMNSIDELYKKDDKTIKKTITAGVTKTIKNLKNTGDKVMYSIGSGIEKIYEETKGDIDKIKNYTNKCLKYGRRLL